MVDLNNRKVITGALAGVAIVAISVGVGVGVTRGKNGAQEPASVDSIPTIADNEDGPLADKESFLRADGLDEDILDEVPEAEEEVLDEVEEVDKSPRYGVDYSDTYGAVPPGGQSKGGQSKGGRPKCGSPSWSSSSKSSKRTKASKSKSAKSKSAKGIELAPDELSATELSVGDDAKSAKAKSAKTVFKGELSANEWSVGNSWGNSWGGRRQCKYLSLPMNPIFL